MLLELLLVGFWLALAVYCFWYFFLAKTFQPLILDDLALMWRLHKRQAGCTASRIHSLLERNNEVVGFKCECGYEFQQKRLITQSYQNARFSWTRQRLSVSRLREENGGKTVIVALHSYKGGTGKTLLSVNLATLFAKMGKKVCLIDLDLRAPSIHSFYSNRTNYWVNDYLSKACKIEKVLFDCTSKDLAKGKLFVGLANPSTEAIREMEAKDRRWEMEALGRLFSLKTALLNDRHFDYVFFDTSPGLQYSSINAIVTADVVLVVMSTDKSDVEGTQRMIHDLYELFKKKTGVIINKTLFEPSSAVNWKNSSVKPVALQLPIIGGVPCSCDILAAGGKCLFASEKPEHPFTKTLREIAANLVLARCFVQATEKFLKLKCSSALPSLFYA
jgi:MinD-like ATPase involved in chromosome partitioning or flagellar assembly